MEGFDSGLDIGVKAIVIGCLQPQNTHVIGSMVTVEAILLVGDEMPIQYMSEFARDIIERGLGVWPKLTEDKVIVSGVNTSHLLADNHASFNPKHLMPIKPLPEEEITKEKELELS